MYQKNIENFNEIQSFHQKIETLDYLVNKNPTNESLLNYEKSFMDSFIESIQTSSNDLSGDLFVSTKAFIPRCQRISHLRMRWNQAISDRSKEFQLVLEEASKKAFEKIGSFNPEILKTLLNLTDEREKSVSSLNNLGTQMYIVSKGVSKDELAEKVLLNLFLLLGESHKNYQQVKDVWKLFQNNSFASVDSSIE